MYQRTIKRIFDVLISCGLLLVFIIPSVFIIILLIFDQKGKVLFIQDRIGHLGKTIRIYKFRTMRACAPGAAVCDQQRITKLGAFLRLTSLDEIPQLINILSGELSLIGPRPLISEYLPLYTARQAKRHLVKPGLTGLAQIKGRNSLSWEEKFEFDIFYVNKLSLSLDIKILFLTIIKVIYPSREEHIIPEKFTGQVNESTDKALCPAS